MLQKTSGIVLHSLKYSDTTMIVEMYTKALGRSSFLVPIGHSKKSAVKSVLFQPLSLMDFEADYRPKRSLFAIRNVKPYLYSSIPYHPVKSSIAIFLAEFLYRVVREDFENDQLFDFLKNSIIWLDESVSDFTNFHLVFLLRLTSFLGLYPNLDNYHRGDSFDLLNSCFIPSSSFQRSYCIRFDEAGTLYQLMRLNYATMNLFKMNRIERRRCITVIIEYYRMHLSDFPEMKSLEVLKELFD
ncbi:MAG: DNA repair protein RecO [Bacteroidaceae bacterium]